MGEYFGGHRAPVRDGGHSLHLENTDRDDSLGSRTGPSQRDGDVVPVYQPSPLSYCPQLLYIVDSCRIIKCLISSLSSLLVHISSVGCSPYLSQICAEQCRLRGPIRASVVLYSW